MKMTLETNAYQSRWGYHPCNYETFLRLKKLNGLYFKALKQQAEWHRWYRKEPQNRVIYKYKRDLQGRRIGKEIVGPRPEPNINSIFLEKKHVKSRWYGEYDTVYITDLPIMQMYQKARKPRKREVVQPLDISKEQIYELYKMIS